MQLEKDCFHLEKKSLKSLNFELGLKIVPTIARILVFCKSGLLQEVVTEGASTVYRLVV